MENNFLKLKDKETIVYYKTQDAKNRLDVLPPGIYSLSNEGGLFDFIPGFTPIQPKESLIKFTQGIIGEIISRVDRFLSPESIQSYKDLGVIQKLGLLMYGPPGTGKTCTAFLIMRTLVSNYGAICIDGTGEGIGFVLNCVGKIRETQNNPIVIFVDEVEKPMSQDLGRWLPYLDGTHSINNSIFIGCTNYLKKVPATIRDRKSRIKHTFEVNSLPLEVYQEFIETKLNVLKPDLKAKITYLSKEAGLTIDEFKHVLIDYWVDKVPIEKAIKAAKFRDKQEDWEDAP